MKSIQAKYKCSRCGDELDAREVDGEILVDLCSSCYENVYDEGWVEGQRHQEGW